MEEHRWCKFSRWGWGLAGVLAVYVLFLHSMFAMERDTYWKSTLKNLFIVLRHESDIQVQASLANIQTSIEEATAQTNSLTYLLTRLQHDQEVLTRYECVAPAKHPVPPIQ